MRRVREPMAHGKHTAPAVDPRSADDVAGEVMSLLEEQVPEWAARTDPETGLPLGAGGALVAGFSRLMELLVERLNRAPDKNFLAFLDLLGASRMPPRPAGVPLVFTPVVGGSGRVRVPRGTRVSAEPREEGGPPRTFETERPLEVVAATLDTVGVRDPATDRYTVRVPAGGLLTDPVHLMRGEAPTSHWLYIRHDELLACAATELRLDVALAEAGFPRDRWRVRWEAWSGDDWIRLRPSLDATYGLARAGGIEFRDVPEVPETTVNGVAGRWLRCGVETPVTGSGVACDGMVRARELPVFRNIGIRQERTDQGLAPDAAFADAAPVDVTSDFFPFGELPRFGSTFYVSQAEAFGTPGGRVTLRVEATNAVSGRGEPPIPRTRPSADLRLRWEVRSGARWEELGTSSPSHDGIGPDGFEDTTRAFSRSGHVTFALPSNVSAGEVNGVSSHWIRVRIVAGDYGRPSSYQPRRGEDGRTEYELVPATLAPPALESLTLTRVAVREAEGPETALACNDFSWSDGTRNLRARDASWRPFTAMKDSAPVLYVGFRTAAEVPVFPGRSLSLWLEIDGTPPGRRSDEAYGARVVWEYWGRAGWTTTPAEDETDGLRQSGAIRLVVPDDFAPRDDFGVRRHWLRARLADGRRLQDPPRLSAVLHNAVWASHAVTVRDEALGSSQGTPGQHFRTRVAPVLPGEHLVVLGNGDEPWQAVPDLHGSGPTDRHYVLNRVSGEILFGDGRSGAVPPAGRGNVRMAFYRSGGGSTGNVPAGSLRKMGTTVPYIAGVTNPVAARGGADAEDLDAVRRRAAASLRHRNRAVTAADFGDLVREAFPDVARVRCVDPADAPGRAARSPGFGGVVRLILVPRSTDPAPYPDAAMILRVQQYLEGRCPVGVEVDIRGPDYVRIDAAAVLGITAAELADSVEASALRALRDFLHPLAGGREREGWPFGRMPERSDLQAVLASLPGVERVVSLRLNMQPTPRPADPRWLLVRPGTLRIGVVLTPDVTR